MAEPGEAAQPEGPGRGTRRTFGPVVLLGLAAGALAAVAGSKPWVSGSSGTIDTAGESGAEMAAVLHLESPAESPLAAALALAGLACWGVLLVTRRRVRRVVAALALVAAVGLLATAVEGFWSRPSALADALVEVSGSDTAATSFTTWYAAACVGALLAVAAAAAAVAWVPAWPEMGARYDSPTGGPSGEPAAADDLASADNLDLWKALDEGRDPTA